MLKNNPNFIGENLFNGTNGSIFPTIILKKHYFTVNLQVIDIFFSTFALEMSPTMGRT